MKPKRLDGDLRRQLARAVACGQSLRSACQEAKVHPSLACRWKKLDSDFRTLLLGAQLLAAMRVLCLLQSCGKMLTVPEPSDADLFTVTEWAWQSIYDDRPAVRREALDLLKTSITSGARIPYLSKAHRVGSDRLAEQGWDSGV